MSQIYEDTADAKAAVYLSSGGSEISRMEFLESVHDGQWSYMLYVGGGYVPLTVAVTTDSHRDYHGGGESDAVSTFEEWARDERPEEIGEGPDYEKEVQEAIAAGEEPPEPEYELHIEEIPRHAGTDPASINQRFFIEADAVTLGEKVVGDPFGSDIGTKLTYADFQLLRAWREMQERLDNWMKEGKRSRPTLYARREAGMKDGRLVLVLRFTVPRRGKRWGEGSLEYLRGALAKLAGELAGEGWEAEVRKVTAGYDLIIESADFDGFHWTSLEVPMRVYKLTDFLVEP